MILARNAIFGAVLTLGLAMTSNAAAQCKDNADCRAGRVCKRGQCVEARCSKDVECPDSGVCEGGVCRPASPLVPVAPPAVAPPVEAAPTAPPRELYRSERRLMPGLYITGPVLLGTMWITTIAVTAAVSAPGDVGRATGYASIPVVGPWVMLGSSLDTSSYVGPLILSGILQSAGLALTIVGFTVRHDVQVRAMAKDDGVRVTFVPSAGGGALVGTF